MYPSRSLATLTPGAILTAKALSDYGVKYRSYQEPYIDTTHEWGDLVAAFAANLAELERKRIQVRVKAGLEKTKN